MTESAFTRELLALTLIILMAFLVRIPGLTESLWFDEIWYTKTMFDQPGTLGYLLWKDVHPPAYALLLLAWTDLFGDSELMVRLPSFLCGLLTLALLWFMTRRWFGPLPALLVTALAALSPPHIWYSHENKVNMMLLLFILYTVWLYWRASETRVTRDWLVASAMMTASLYTHSYTVPVAAGVYGWLTWRALSDRTLFKPILLTGVVIAAAFSPMVILKLGQLEELARPYLRQLTPAELYKLLLVWLPSGNVLRTIGPYQPFSRLAAQPWPYFLIDAFFAFLLLRGLWTMGQAARGDGWFKPVSDPMASEPARLVLLWFTVPLVFTMLGSLVMKDFYIERNLLVILPPFLMLLVAGAWMRAPSWLRIVGISGLLLLALAATVSLRTIKSEVWTVYKYKPDWRSAMHFMYEDLEAAGIPRILVTTPAEPVSYYHRRILSDRVGMKSSQKPFFRSVCGVEPDTVIQEISRRDWSSFYLVHNRTWSGCWNTVWDSFSVSPAIELAEQKSFKGMDVYRFTFNR